MTIDNRGTGRLPGTEVPCDYFGFCGIGSLFNHPFSPNRQYLHIAHTPHLAHTSDRPVLPSGVPPLYLSPPTIDTRQELSPVPHPLLLYAQRLARRSSPPACGDEPTNRPPPSPPTPPGQRRATRPPPKDPKISSPPPLPPPPIPPQHTQEHLPADLHPPSHASPPPAERHVPPGWHALSRERRAGSSRQRARDGVAHHLGSEATSGGLVLPVAWRYVVVVSETDPAGRRC